MQGKSWAVREETGEPQLDAICDRAGSRPSPDGIAARHVEVPTNDEANRGVGGRADLDACLRHWRRRAVSARGAPLDIEIEQSYLSPEIGPDAVGAFFRAAAGLFRDKPWKIVPTDQSILSVTIDKLEVRDAAMSVIGQMRQSLGFILFSGIDDFEAYLEAADAMEHGEEPVMPPHFALNFERRAELGAALRKEIAEYHWEVAAGDAYPWLMAIDEDLQGVTAFAIDLDTRALFPPLGDAPLGTEATPHPSHERHRDRLNELWNAYCLRHPHHRERFARRSATMHGLAGRIVAARPKQKVGRNALCPCGSGKKLKRCCGVA
jgi:SEC-C motif